MAHAAAVVMAAGKGTRMKSELPKVLVPVLGRPMIHYVLDTLERAGVDQTVVVVGYRADDVQRELASRKNLRCALQAQQLGTGHAVLMCREALADYQGPVIVLAGDSPMIRPNSLRRLLDEFAKTRPACLLGTAHKTDPAGLGRIVRDHQGRFQAIVEEKDATPEERKLTEVNLSCYVFDCRQLFWALDQIRPDNAQGEYYLTDCPGKLLAAGQRVEALAVLQPSEALSINSPDELAVVEAAMQSEGNP